MPSEYPYTPNYYDENIWQLCKHPKFAALEKYVLIVSNEDRYCHLHHHGDGLVIWDYHVMLLVKEATWVVYDLDSTLPLPSPLAPYVEKTFTSEEEKYLPRFLVIGAEDYVRRFNSDRSHMIDDQGNWKFTPPEWPMIKSNDPEYDLGSLIDFKAQAEQTISIEALLERFQD